MSSPLSRHLLDLGRRWRGLRRRVKAAAPYVRRREYRILERRHAALFDSVLDGRRAADAWLTVQQPLRPLAGDCCLFVTHAPQAALKPHVRWHVEHLLDAGVQVVLVANADQHLDALAIDSALRDRLSGVLVRENVGFDFAAWAHALALCGDVSAVRRLMLVNDSIVGPLDAAAFGKMMGEIRASPHDVIGLTENHVPVPHLQSFFLVLGARALAAPVLRRFLEGVLVLPTKDQVIDLYETRLTQRLRGAGLTTHALFAAISSDRYHSNDTYFHWHELVEAGFPYVKTRVLVDFGDDPRLAALLPAALRR